MIRGQSFEQPGPGRESEYSSDNDGLRSLMELLASYYGITVAVVLKYNGRGVKVIAGVGLLEVKLRTGLGVDTFLKHGDFVCPDASVDARFKSLQVVTGIWGMRLVVVKNLICEISGDSYFLLLADSSPRHLDHAPTLDGLNDIAQLACAKLHISRIIRTIQALTQEINASPDVLARLFDDVIFPVVATSPDLDILSINEAALPYIARPADGLKGRTLQDLFPVHHKVFEDMGRTIFSEKAQSQDIEVEFVNPRDDTPGEYLNITLFPLFDDNAKILMITGIACDVTAARQMEQKIRNDISAPERGFSERRNAETETPDPVLGFLLDTLVEQRALRSRNKISYLTVRTWRKPIKTYQIKALKSLKRSAPDKCAAAVGGEMIHVISAMVGTDSFDGIIAIPCGHSGDDKCLSTMIADNLSLRTGIPVFRAFAPRPLSGSSHPKASAKMPKLKLRAEPKGHYLLVDDVVTSGRHLEEAVELLRDAGADVMAIAWVGGEKA